MKISWTFFFHAIREVADDVGISIGSCHEILSNSLGMKRVAAKFVPKLLYKVHNEYSWRFYHTSGACIPHNKKKFDNRTLQTREIKKFPLFSEHTSYDFQKCEFWKICIWEKIVWKDSYCARLAQLSTTFIFSKFTFLKIICLNKFPNS